MKVFASLLLSPILSHKIDISAIPEQEIIEKMLEEIEFKYPGIYGALIDERDNYMAEKLLKLSEERPNQKIVAFVGAGHKKGIEQYLNEKTEQKDD